MPSRVPGRPAATSIASVGQVQGRGSVGLLWVVVAVEVVWITTQGRWHGAGAWVPVISAVVAHGCLLSRVRRRDDLSGAAALSAVVVVAVAAVAAAPHGSRDLFQYAFYGRMVAQHGADPYALAPGALPDDPTFAQLAPGWHGARSVYGPVFTWFSAVGVHVFGVSALGARLWFQGAAALALVASANRLRRERGAAAVVAIGLSPVLVVTVNGGHNDLLVGWLVLIGASLATRGRPLPAGVVLGLATCVKVSAAPLVLAIVVVGWHRRRHRSVLVGLVAWAGIVVGAYGLGGGAHLLGPLGAVGARSSRASSWAIVERIGGPGFLAAAGAVTVVAIAIVAWRWRSASPEEAGTAAGAAACFAAPYVLVWYPAAVLPVSGRALGSRASSILHLGASALLLAYVVPAGEPPGAVPLAPSAAVACGVVLLVLLGMLLGGVRGPGAVRFRGLMQHESS